MLKASESLTGLKSLTRRENLIAIFENGFAVGWKFQVPDVFKEALDIRLTPVSVHKQQYNTWTQGHSYSFHRGDSIKSHAYAEWKDFLNTEGAVSLSIKYCSPAGFVENVRLSGEFTGMLYSSKSTKSAKKIDNQTINASNYIYDSGDLTVEILKPNKNKTAVEVTDTISISQVDFVTLLQHGYYWSKPKDKNETEKIEKIILVS
jgi:hypothetical protein